MVWHLHIIDPHNGAIPCLNFLHTAFFEKRGKPTASQATVPITNVLVARIQLWRDPRCFRMDTPWSRLQRPIEANSTMRVLLFESPANNNMYTDLIKKRNHLDVFILL